MRYNHTTMTVLYSVITALTFFLMPAPTILYSAELEAIVTLPAGYFVMQSSETAPDGYVSVIYDNISGYVKLADVTQTDYTPVTKYEKTVTFTCDNDGQPVNLRSAPQKTAPVVSVLSPDCKGRSYGYITGDALIVGAGELWYYVDANGFKGYCYSAHIKVDPTPPNIIEKEPPDEPDRPAVTEPTDEPDPPTMPQWTAIVFIVVMCIPVPFIMFYLFRKPKNNDDDRNE